jgi:pimeloyl-ACP methyl ester carboxylesterase
MLEQFFKEKNIEKFSLMAFSMGGKFALATLEKYPHRLEELILIAPDGIKTNFWYSLATYPSFFRRIFRNMVANPTFYFNLVELLKRLKLVDKGVIRFSETQMQTREQRRRVFYSWTVFRKLSFDLNYLVALLNRYSVTLTVFLGRYDKIVEPHSILPFASRVTRNYIHILESGHTKLLVAVADWFRNR